MNDRGIISSLFDLSFTHCIAPKLWRILYVLFLIVAAVAGLGVFVTVLGMGSGFFGTVGSLLLAIPASALAFLLIAMYTRVSVEILIVVFRGVEYLRELTDAVKGGRGL